MLLEFYPLGLRSFDRGRTVRLDRLVDRRYVVVAVVPLIASAKILPKPLSSAIQMFDGSICAGSVPPRRMLWLSMNALAQKG
jgi:hypothetical protein